MEEMDKLRYRLEALRRRVIFTLVLLVALTTWLIVQLPAMTARRDAVIVAALAEQLAGSAAAGGAAIEQAILVKVPGNVTYAPYRWRDGTPLAFWQYHAGATQPVTEAAFLTARRLGDQWLLAYALRGQAGGALQVDVAVFYPAAGLGPEDPRGGYASHWQLTHTGGRWQLADEVVYLFWD